MTRSLQAPCLGGRARHHWPGVLTHRAACLWRRVTWLLGGWAFPGARGGTGSWEGAPGHYGGLDVTCEEWALPGRRGATDQVSHGMGHAFRLPRKQWALWGVTSCGNTFLLGAVGAGPSPTPSWAPSPPAPSEPALATGRGFHEDLPSWLKQIGAAGPGTWPPGPLRLRGEVWEAQGWDQTPRAAGPGALFLRPALPVAVTDSLSFLRRA